ncbi:MAG: UDP-2,3-diacylglucosamine diphosphatase [Sphingobacteriaceae bacterium]|nr:UDP-2,3-diacylglucosamine diphosphatase [Sphingobacteriaceae bacterium]
MSVKKIYFASDFHLGVPTHELSLIREKAICRWLDQIKTDASEIFLVGDIFDFWYEYIYTIPKGTTRFLGKIAELSDAGIKISFFTGNHDLWMKNYFTEELGVSVYHEPIIREFNGKKFYIGHGDGMGPGDKGYKLLKLIFTSKVCQWLYSRLHPNLAFYLAKKASKRSRIITADSDEKFLGEENEWLFLYSKDYLKKEPIDYFVFGHRHLPLEMKINEKSTYYNLGEWINYKSYAEFDGTAMKLINFKH